MRLENYIGFYKTGRAYVNVTLTQNKDNKKFNKKSVVAKFNKNSGRLNC